jgi:hypothetical protein
MTSAAAPRPVGVDGRLFAPVVGLFSGGWAAWNRLLHKVFSRLTGVEEPR